MRRRGKKHTFCVEDGIGDIEKSSVFSTAVILEFFGHIGIGDYIDVDSVGEVEVAESVNNDDTVMYKAVSWI